ncbi:MAG TPA: hypothetical protein VEY69_18405 [Lautropia sp.]|jgi:hypothetical protein|nr:hypothetical protein [Lautropia sp.]
MFGFDNIDFQRITVALIGAMMLSAVSVGAAVAPAEIGTVMPAAAVGQPLIASHA